jgi:hypothetical protein
MKLLLHEKRTGAFAAAGPAAFARLMKKKMGYAPLQASGDGMKLW